jgi:uncharacterized protein YqjF (DUF2071 family)
MSSGSLTVNSALAPAKARPLRRVFLSARWQRLAMLNWRVDPRLIEPYLPRGVELDFHEGQTFVSVVGFLFRETRVLGLGIPGHCNFEEVNLRFYVRRLVAGEVRRGVAFVREIVPRWAIAQTARICYNEPYVALPMQHEIIEPGGLESAGRVVYRWRMQGHWNSLELDYRGERSPLVPGSHEEFIAEHYWGYCGQRRSATIEYEVVHAPWNIWRATAARLDCSAAAALYGPALAEVLAAPPTTAFLADGSSVAVLWPERIS